MMPEHLFDPDRLRDHPVAVGAYYRAVDALLRSRSNQRFTEPMQTAWEDLGRLQSAVFRSGAADRA